MCSGVGAELVCDAIIQHGTDRQREKYVKPLLKGEMFAAECLTEPRGGSDFFGTTTTAVRQGDDYILNGQKRFIVGAEGADYFLVYAKTDPAAKPHEALTCFIVDRGPGVETRYLYNLMGCRGGGAGRLIFKDVAVPAENIVGQLNNAYAVFNTMMIPERLGTAAMTIGAARPALDIATRYTSRRRAFGQTINQFQGVSFQIAESAMLLDAARAMIFTTARAVDDHCAPPLYPASGVRNQEVCHRVLPECCPSCHAGNGRHRLHGYFPGGTHHSRSAAGVHLDGQQRGHGHDHRQRMVP